MENSGKDQGLPPSSAAAVRRKSTASSGHSKFADLSNIPGKNNDSNLQILAEASAKIDTIRGTSADDNNTDDDKTMADPNNLFAGHSRQSSNNHDLMSINNSSSNRDNNMSWDSKHPSLGLSFDSCSSPVQDVSRISTSSSVHNMSVNKSADCSNIFDNTTALQSRMNANEASSTATPNFTTTASALDSISPKNPIETTCSSKNDKTTGKRVRSADDVSDDRDANNNVLNDGTDGTQTATVFTGKRVRLGDAVPDDRDANNNVPNDATGGTQTATAFSASPLTEASTGTTKTVESTNKHVDNEDDEENGTDDDFGGDNNDDAIHVDDNVDVDGPESVLPIKSSAKLNQGLFSSVPRRTGLIRSAADPPFATKMSLAASASISTAAAQEESFSSVADKGRVSAPAVSGATSEKPAAVVVAPHSVPVLPNQTALQPVAPSLLAAAATANSMTVGMLPVPLAAAKSLTTGTGTGTRVGESPPRRGMEPLFARNSLLSASTFTRTAASSPSMTLLANRKGCSNRTKKNEQELRIILKIICEFLYRLKIIQSFRNFSKDNIQKNNCAGYLPAKLAFEYLLCDDRSKDKCNHLERILALLFQYDEVKNHYGIIMATLEAIYATKYKDRSGSIKCLVEADNMVAVKDTKVVTNLDGTWDEGEGESYVDGKWDNKKTVIYVSNISEDLFGNCVIRNGHDYYGVHTMVLRNKKKKKKEFVTIIKVSGNLQQYQVAGEKESTWKDLCDRYEGEGYEIFLMSYKMKKITDKDMVNYKGGWKMVRTSKRLTVVKAVENDKRYCMVDFVRNFLRSLNMKEKNGKNYELQTLRDEFDITMGKPEKGENIHVNKVIAFMKKKVSGYNFSKSLKDRFIKYKDSDNDGPTHNKIFAQTNGKYLILVSYRDKNETKALDADRHALFLHGQKKGKTNVSYVADGDKKWSIEGRDGENDETMQKLLQEIWGNASQIYEVANVWEIRKTGNK